MISTNIEKNSAVSEEGHVFDSSWFFSGSKLGQYADQELLKSLFQNKTPDLNLNYVLIRSAVRIKENRPKGKIVSKNKHKTGKNGTN